jgi:hypothetical protein
LAYSVREEYNKTAGKKIGEMNQLDSQQTRSISSIRTKRNPLKTALLATAV